MKQVWSSEELNEFWLLNNDEFFLLKGRTSSGRILFAALLKYYQYHARFSSSLSSIPDCVWEFLAFQIDAEFEGIDKNPKSLKRSLRDYARSIRAFLNIRSFDDEGMSNLEHWIISWLLPQVPDEGWRQSDIQSWFCKNRYEMPGRSALARLINSAERKFEHQLFSKIIARLNSFIYYGSSGKFATNKVEEQEISTLCLHLLQSSMVYINTLMIQEVLSEANWHERMTARDFEGLSPLPHKHYNPYGLFNLDMSTRLPLNTLETAA